MTKNLLKASFTLFLLSHSHLLYAKPIIFSTIVIDKSKEYKSRTISMNSPEYDYSTSVEEYLGFFSNIDLRKRASNGLQQDISIRGSTFQDNIININGVDISDPQTGHYSLEIPFTKYDIETINIEPNTNTINLNIKKPSSKGVYFEHTCGEHALFNDIISLNFAVKNIRNRLSYEHKISKGAKQDNDFKIHNLSFFSFWEKENNKINFIFATTQRDFGADSFYSSAFPQEEEHINQKLFILETENNKDYFSLKNKIFLRRHEDKFILERHDPSFYTNYHTTYKYGYQTLLSFKNVSFSFGINKEKITSTNLGNHTRYKKDLQVILKNSFGRVDYNVNLTQSYYGRFGWLNTTSVTTDYILHEKAIIHLIFANLWRPPSFTELYYESPANQGDNKLKVQKSKAWEISLDYKVSDNFDLKTGVFLRKQSNTIDWIKKNSTAVWQVANIGKISSKGIDSSVNITFRNSLIKRFILNYTYLNIDGENPYYASKYAFSYAKHKVCGIFVMEIKGFTVNWALSFLNPVDRKKYCVFNIKISKPVGNNLSIFLTVDNIFNTDYEPLKGINGEDRWCKWGITLHF